MTAIESAAQRAFSEAPSPAAVESWRDVQFTVIDLETTGLDPATDEIVSFATVTVSGGLITLGDAQYELVRPERMPEADTTRIHGLREADLAGAAPLSTHLDTLLAALAGRLLVAHVADIERGFLAAALRSRGLELPNPMIDTAEMDRELRRLRGPPPAERTPIGLSEMARSLGLPVHRPHHADGDALTTAQAFIALATHLERFEAPLTIGALQRISDRTGRRPTGGPVRRLLQRLRP
jgi:DNA polymerase III subunit epsilon